MASTPFFVRGVAEVSTTVGGGPYVLGGALPGFARFAQLVPDGQVVNYYATDGVNSEWAQGVYSVADNTLTRGQISFSTTGGVVNWGPGRRIIQLDSGDDPAAFGVRSIAGQTGHVSAGAIAAIAELPDSGVTPGSYTNTNITVNAKGQVTAAANGTGGGGGGGGLFANLIANGPPPDLSHWTQLNFSGSAVAADSAVGPTISDGLNNSHQKRALVMSAPAAPYVADFLLGLDIPGDNNVTLGVGWGSVGTGTASDVGGIGVEGSSMGVLHYSTSTSSPTTWKLATRLFGALLCFRLKDDGFAANHVEVHRSADGENFNLHYGDVRSNTGQIKGGAFDRIGFWLDMYDPTPVVDPSTSGSITLLAYYVH